MKALNALSCTAFFARTLANTALLVAKLPTSTVDSIYTSSPFVYNQATLSTSTSFALPKPSGRLISDSHSLTTNFVLISSDFTSTSSQTATESTSGTPASTALTSTFASLATNVNPSPSTSGSVATTVISTPTAGPSILADINTIHVRRLPFIISSVNGATDISAWLSTLGSNGQWPASEIDYTSGCSAQRANWPAEAHWQRIVTMSAAFHGGLVNADQWVNNLDLRAAISLAMDFWFSDDFTNIACLDSGGLASCSCGTPGFWDPNWFSNIIGIPELVGQSCLLLNSTLTSTQLSNCTNITGRAYATFDRSINGVGTLTGANTLDVASIGIDLGILTVNASQIADAYGRVHNEVMVQQGSRADGIRPDGSFGQHAGIIYNGNYGKDHTNDVLALEIEASGTQFEADLASKEAFMSLISGDEWMIYRNMETDVLHWDFSVLGRFISFPVADNQATASIKINITELQVLGEEWDSDTLTNAYNSLSKNTTNANVGSLNGNRVFYDNDYMVQRGPGYVTSLRMYSTRTTNTECINSQNPFGFHLSDGTIYTYMTGSEYEDIAAAWDFNLIPGTTVDYNATHLSCSQTGFRGLEAFVGGASTGRIGMGAMRYTNPLTQSLHWQKAWFFFEGGAQHVVVTNLSSAASTPVFSVLDQRKHVSDIYVDGVPVSSGNFTNASSLWHGNVGYIFSPGQGFSNASGPGVSLSVDVGLRTGNWSALGISTQPPPTVDLFAAWIEHTNLSMPVSYTAFPAVTFPEFLNQAGETQIMDILNDGAVSAVLDVPHKTAMVVFWEEGGGNVTIPPCSLWEAPIFLSSDTGLLVILEEKTWMLTVTDPTQIAVDVEVVLQLGPGTPPKGWGHEKTKTVSVVLPAGSTAGSSISVSLNGTSVQRML